MRLAIRASIPSLESWSALLFSLPFALIVPFSSSRSPNGHFDLPSPVSRHIASEQDVSCHDFGENPRCSSEGSRQGWGLHPGAVEDGRDDQSGDHKGIENDENDKINTRQPLKLSGVRQDSRGRVRPLLEHRWETHTHRAHVFHARGG